jgi:hypothetical protein
MALAIGAVGYGASFAAVAAFPLVAALFVPVAAERAAATGRRAASGSVLPPAPASAPERG